ncbi:MAG: nucleoside-diphosphate sugar epimerase/dehydratase [Alphaproteobacteria bacterium]|nr:nucleoside-diphosphate sugar epimerase/dehydratase [Alphaproteobacteria bacterium]
MFRQICKLLIDVSGAGAAFLLALMLRSGLDFLKLSPPAVIQGVLLMTAICAAVFAAGRLYRGVWHYTSLADLKRLVVMVTIAVGLYAVVQGLWTGFEGLPRSSVPIAWGAMLITLGGARVAFRMRYDRYLSDRGTAGKVPVLLIGAGDGAELFVRATQRSSASPYRVIGILPINRERLKGQIHGVDVMGHVDQLDVLLRDPRMQRRRPQRLVVTSDAFVGPKLEAAVELADRHGLSISRMPRLTDLASHSEDGALPMRPIAIEDLLGRPQTPLDRDAMAELIVGRRVAVTGAGGSIGGELCRQIAAFGPTRMTLIDFSEHNLYTIDRELAGRAPGVARRAVLGDVREPLLLDQVMRQERPELVFHAAALKHVPMAEENPLETALTNVEGTRTVAQACRAHGVAAMVLVSTDKAVRPTNFMGATKRVAEMLCQAFDVDGESRGGTRFLTVRFGNVLGSSGSVVPLFQEQIANGGPVTVTDPDVTRYFMTIREAVELVLEASAIGFRDGKAAGKIFVLDMGEPVRIADLAAQMIRLAGKHPGEDIEVQFTGLRPGEKLHEELLDDQEALVESGYQGLLLAAPRVLEASMVLAATEKIAEAARARDRERCVDLIRRLVPEYQADPRLLAGLNASQEIAASD